MKLPRRGLDLGRRGSFGCPSPETPHPSGAGLRGRSRESLLRRGHTPVHSLPSSSVPATTQGNGDLKYCRIALKCRVNLKGLVEEMQCLDFNIFVW